MVNIICVKWGTKYSADWVNRLLYMCSINISIPFNFYCYTDESSGINKKVKIIPITTEDYYEGYWNKLCMFQEDFIDSGDINLFFDLDIVIQNNLDNFIKEQLRDNLSMIRAYWKKDKVTDGSSPKFKEKWDMYANSSVLLWKNKSLGYIWNHFDSNPDFFMTKYKGIDRFLFHENMPLSFFPKKLIYSRINGVDETDFYKGKAFKNQVKRYDFEGIPFDNVVLHHHPEMLICIFNGPSEDWMYEEFKQYYS
mgnify:FL=1|tara:strand:+ start:1331 stop:2086 length:756 start_codon:yes stop_codon:yes gene_type:complete